ncbi:hypothetical protein ACFXGI_03535 [Streptomyces sp. NPDC059355]|uniref:hypothetical protein n=1 Tax=Streptomyces sp. NPDC059355 TaxID=3346811 RepID=UPI0036D04A8E
MAVENGYFVDNPLAGIRWNAPSVEGEADPASVPDPLQVARSLSAVGQQRGRGPHLEAFFGCMYFAAMRPAEVIHLRREQCHLPETGWGLLNLTGGVVTAGKDWTDDGEVYEVHSLKRRAATATRPVPIPPQFVRVLRAHVERFGAAPDGRLFQNQAGNHSGVDRNSRSGVGRAREELGGPGKADVRVERVEPTAPDGQKPRSGAVFSRFWKKPSRFGE